MSLNPGPYSHKMLFTVAGIVGYTVAMMIAVVYFWLASDDGPRDAISILFFGVALAPAIIGSFFARRRCLQVLETFGEGARVLRRRFKFAHAFLLVAPTCFFISFQSIIPVGTGQIKLLIFTAGFVSLTLMIGFLFLAWNVWWDGLDPRIKAMVKERRQRGK